MNPIVVIIVRIVVYLYIYIYIRILRYIASIICIRLYAQKAYINYYNIIIHTHTRNSSKVINIYCNI